MWHFLKGLIVRAGWFILPIAWAVAAHFGWFDTDKDKDKDIWFFAKDIWVFAVAFGCSAISELSDMRLAKKLQSLLRAAQTNGKIVADAYSIDLKQNARMGGLIVFLCFLAALISRDFVLTYLIGIILVAIIAFPLLTQYRATRGWFANNSFEVLELLQFIIAKN